MQYDFKMYVNGNLKFTRRLFCKNDDILFAIGHGMMYAMFSFYKHPYLMIYRDNGEIVTKIH